MMVSKTNVKREKEWDAAAEGKNVSVLYRISFRVHAFLSRFFIVMEHLKSVRNSSNNSASVADTTKYIKIADESDAIEMIATRRDGQSDKGKMSNGEFSFRYHLTLIASTRLQMPLFLQCLDVHRRLHSWIKSSLSALFFFCIMCSHHLQHINTLCMIIHHYALFFVLSLPFMDLRRQSFTAADAMSFAYHIGDLRNYFKQQLLLSPSFLLLISFFAHSLGVNLLCV